MEELVRHSGQTVLLILLLLHPGELGHVDEAAVEDDLGLRVLGRPLELESLDPSFTSQSIEQVLSIVVDITKNDPLVPLTVSQGQLLERNLVLLGLANGNGDAILVCRLVEWKCRRLPPGRRLGLGWLATARLPYRLEGYVLDPHRHRNRVEDLLEGLGLERLWRLAQRELARVIDRLRPHGDTHTLGWHWRELHEVSHQLCRVDSRDFGRLGQFTARA